MYLFTDSKTALKEAVMRTSERVLAYELLAGDWRRLDLLWDRIPAADRKTLQLVRVGEGKHDDRGMGHRKSRAGAV